MRADTFSKGKVILQVQNLKAHFILSMKKCVKAVDGVNLEIKEGEIIGLVGESGSGKTVFSLSVLQLLTSKNTNISGQIRWKNFELTKMTESSLRLIRGKEIAMIFQNPQSALNPVKTIGKQMMRIVALHSKLSKKDKRKRVMELLISVNVPEPQRVFDAYPHQLSLGMCQRVMIAMALSAGPKLLLADEPTASLDVTIQAQIIDLLLKKRDQLKMAILLVSHDLGMVARMCDRIAVMYLGRIVETAPSEELFQHPTHPYTKALIKCIPVADPTRKSKIPILEGELPGGLDIPTGCRFRNRCPSVFQDCTSIEPENYAVGAEHYAACLMYKDRKQNFIKSQGVK